MRKAGKALQLSYPRLIHTTCLDHALHNLCETIRDQYPAVDLLISEGKKVFLKSPKRIRKFRDWYPNIPLPPKPVITRWGTWLKATIYYAENFESVKRVIDSFNSKDAKCISTCQELFAVCLVIFPFFFFLILFNFYFFSLN